MDSNQMKKENRAMDNFSLIYGDLGAGEITETPASFEELRQRF